MSKIGNFNIAMTEKVNELGYDTVEEAIADGWDSNEFYASYNKQLRDQREEAHDAWLKERDDVILGLHAVRVYLEKLQGRTAKDKEKLLEVAMLLDKMHTYTEQAIEFIKRGEI